jgi:hypothetical protein
MFNKNQFNQQADQSAQQPGQAPRPTGAPSPTPGQTQPQPGTQAPKSGAFTNVQTFVQANQPGQLGRGIQQQGQQAAQKTAQEVAQGQQSLQEGASSAQQAQREALQRLQQAQSSGDLKQLESQYQQVQGMNTDTGVANRQGIVSAARRAQQMAQLAGSEGGQAALLRAQYGQQGLTQGGLGLDQMLLASSGTDLSDLRRLGSQATRSVEDLMTQESATQQGLSQELAAVKGEALGSLQTELGQKMDTVQGQATGINQALQSIQKKLTENLKPNTWGMLPTAEEVLSRLTPEERQVFMQYGGGDLSLVGGRNEMTRQLQQLGQTIGQISEQDQIKLMTPEQRARAEVLARLSQRGDLAEQVLNIGDQKVQGLVGETDSAGIKSGIQTELARLNQAREPLAANLAVINAERAPLQQQRNELVVTRSNKAGRLAQLEALEPMARSQNMNEINRLKSEIAGMDQQIQAKDTTLSGLKQQRDQAQAVLSSKDSDIQRQQERLSNQFNILDFLRRR